MKYNSRNIQARIKGRCEEKKSIFIYLKIKKKKQKRGCRGLFKKKLVRKKYGIYYLLREFFFLKSFAMGMNHGRFSCKYSYVAFHELL